MKDELEALRREVARLREQTEHDAVERTALALVRARLFDREQQARQRVDVLSRATRRFAETTFDLSLLDHLAAEIGELLTGAVEIALVTDDRAPGVFHPDPAAMNQLRAGNRLADDASAYVVQLRAHGRVLGHLTATRSPDYQPFSPDDLALLEDLADRAAISIENSRLYRENQVARSHAEQLFLFAQAVVAAERIEQVFDAALESIQRALGTRRAAILVADADGSMRFRAWRGVSEAYRRGAESVSPWPRNVHAPRPIVIRDVVTEAELPDDLELLRDDAIGSLAFVPLIIGGRVIGKFSVYYDQPRSYPAHDLELAMSIANHLASAIRRFEAVAKLEDTVRYAEMFTGILAHDLRNPLGSILTVTQILERRSPDPELAKAIGHITNACMRMSRMIDQATDFSQARVMGGIQVAKRPIDLAEVFQRAISDVQHAFPDRAVKVASRGDFAGRWDPGRLQQIFSNLVVNAVQHGKADADVGIELDGTSAEAVALRVHNGGAIPPAMLPTLFDAFCDREERRSRSRGLGLGLFIVRELVAAHGGTVQVTSSEETGTTFALQLPRDLA